MSCECSEARAAGLDPAVRPVRPTTRTRRPGFTIVELCVTLAILGLLLALILPAVQSVRAAARLTECQNHLHQIGTALHQYEGIHGMWAPGMAYGHSWHIAILPMIDRRDLFDQVQDRVGFGPYAPSIRHHQIDIYLCPADNEPAVNSGWGDPGPVAATSYQGCSGTGALHGGYNGLFRHLPAWQPKLFEDGPVRSADIPDGRSNTAAVSEVLHSTGEVPPERLRGVWDLPDRYTSAEFAQFQAACEALPDDPAEVGYQGFPAMRGFAWVEGNLGFSMYNHTLAPNQPSCLSQGRNPTGIYTAASLHPGIVQVLYADNHLSGVSESVDRTIWMACGSRNGSEPHGPP
jgi:prepilin-type N-terminal cleavage/methylation domain-containing protein